MPLIPYTLRYKMVARLHRSYLSMDLPLVATAPLVAAERVLFQRRMREITIVKPIFIVGCHRSGTTVLYEALASYPHVAYFSNASAILPQAPILSNWLCRALGLNEVSQERFLKDDILFTPATPNEGIRIWEQFAPSGPDYYLDESNRDPRMARYIRFTIKKHLRYFHASRFINKNPDNSVRMRYLNWLFPDAYFVHIVRDGRAVCSSLLKARNLARTFFGPQHRHATSGTKVQGWDAIAAQWDIDPVAASGQLWRDVLATIERDRLAISSERYRTVRYEDFVAAPLETLKDLARFCDLPLTAQGEHSLAAAAATLALGERNDAWKKRFSAQDLERLTPIIAPTMQYYGY